MASRKSGGVQDQRLSPSRRRGGLLAAFHWRPLFNFTQPVHAAILVPGLLLAIVAGILQPALAIFFGKFFNSFSQYGGGTITGAQLMQRTLVDVFALLGIGAATWILKGSYFALWIVFGEMQAKSVRDRLFGHLVQKDLAWFDSRTTGVGALLSRIQS